MSYNYRKLKDNSIIFLYFMQEKKTHFSKKRLLEQYQNLKFKLKMRFYFILFNIIRVSVPFGKYTLISG